ncbi:MULTISPECIES: permease-like cell division protein FtsX [Tepidibacillus]|uniref:Cell division protein FtsX n=1 Tax=Tepidibacillus decaturensis TaxID=1413211 RepID=A0A135L6A0_9BACI|nr:MULTISPECIES: permease-like cell division protein FtsX [Tepidibacillus]KXG44427.1 cell division protein FtsX [Tepidibacillus decaturensis]GBF10591.1 cell division protein FtsX [Tepidibacillus sp. HK-1]
MNLNTVGRHIKEGFRNIGRNGWMTFASVSAVAITLLILGVFLLLAMNVNYMTKIIEDQVEITVELDLNAKDAQIKAIENEIRNMDGVKSVTFISKEELLKQLKERLGKDAYLLEGFDEENSLYDSFQVRAFNPETTGQVAEKIAKIQMVSNVDYGKATVEKLFAVTKWVRNIGLAFTLGLAFTAMFLISNTIKITIYARRREIQIMKLVGATNWFIRWPFFVEGFLLGVLGSIGPIILLYIGYRTLLDKVNLSFLFFKFLPVYPLTYQISLILVVIGAFIGIWGSMMSVRRFLKI